MEEHGEPFYLFTEATQSINLEPQEINKGNCENWAVYVTDRLPQAESVWLDDEPDGPAHCAVLLGHRVNFAKVSIPDGRAKPRDLLHGGPNASKQSKPSTHQSNHSQRSQDRGTADNQAEHSTQTEDIMSIATLWKSWTTLAGVIVIMWMLSVGTAHPQDKVRKTHQETMAQKFYLGHCPDDVEGESPKNNWTISYDNEADEGTATCSYLVYDEEAN